MKYWFNEPELKAILPLAASSAVRGLSSNFNTPRIFMGPNTLPKGKGLGASPIDLIGAKCSKKRAFIVTDDFAKRFSSRVIKAFEASGFETQLWSNALPEAPLSNVIECSEIMSQFNPDLIVALGGGSIIDGAKGAWIYYERPDITDLRVLSPFEPLGLRKKAIFAAIPTTSGTGSECTATAVIHDTESDRKIPVANSDLLPDFAILVPEFTMTMPPKLTVGTGLDVLSHAMDAIMSPAASDLSDAISLSAIKMVFKFLPRAYHHGQDREARFRMLVASSLGGIAIQTSGAALTHSFGHSLGSLFHIHHGIAVGIFIPFVFQFYQEVSDKYLEICDALKIEGKTKQERFHGLMEKIRTLFEELDVPLNLKDLDISEENLEKNMEKLALFTHEDIDSVFSPRPITIDQCKKIFRYAFEGKDIDF